MGGMTVGGNRFCTGPLIGSFDFSKKVSEIYAGLDVAAILKALLIFKSLSNGVMTTIRETFFAPGCQARWDPFQARQ